MRHSDGYWDYYETIGGGMGASRYANGTGSVQTHMTNTRNTPVEVMETQYPVVIHRYAIRDNSGGAGLHRGGDGLIREFEFLAPTQITLLTERRSHCAWGLNGGSDAQPGQNRVNDKPMPAKFSCRLQTGDRLTVYTSGGGGWGKVPQ